MDEGLCQQRCGAAVQLVHFCHPTQDSLNFVERGQPKDKPEHLK